METEWTLGKPVADVPKAYQRRGQRGEILAQAEKALEAAPGKLVPVLLPPEITARVASQRLYQAIHHYRKTGRFARLRVRVVNGQLYLGRLTEEEAAHVNGR